MFTSSDYFIQEIQFSSLTFDEHSLRVMDKIKQSMLKYMKATNTKNVFEMTLLLSYQI